MSNSKEKVILKRLYRFRGDPNPFAEVVYANFKNIDTTENVTHSKEEIVRMMMSDQMVGLLLYLEGKVIGYLLGEFTLLQDGRLVYFMSYIYILPKYRKRGLGDALIRGIKKECREFGVYHILLMTDLSKSEVRNFYLKRGFVVDTFLDDKKSKYTPLICSMVFV